MKLLRIPLIIFFVLFAAVAGAIIARVTGLWPADEATRSMSPRTRMP